MLEGLPGTDTFSFFNWTRPFAVPTQFCSDFLNESDQKTNEQPFDQVDCQDRHHRCEIYPIKRFNKTPEGVKYGVRNPGYPYTQRFVWGHEHGQKHMQEKQKYGRSGKNLNK